MKKHEIVLRGTRYAIPEPYYAVHGTYSFEIYDETGMGCTLYEHGYTANVGDDQPYFVTSDQKRIPLRKVM